MSTRCEASEHPPTVIRTVGLTKLYQRRTVVNALDLDVRPGEIYGFLGPNGAGKTTTIRMLLGLMRPSSGSIELFGQHVGHDPATLRRVGVVSEQPFLYDDMTAVEYLLFFARLYRVSDARGRAAMLLERLDLAPYCHLLARDFSRGMQQKLSLARALLHRPELLILDEPVAGLDPQGIVQVREMLEEERRAGHAVFISSHILSEVERIADRVGIVHHGRLLLEDTVEAVRSSLSPGIELEVELLAAVPGLEHLLQRIEGIRAVTRDGHRLAIALGHECDLRAVVAQAIATAGGVVIGMQARTASLEEAFVTLTEGHLESLKPSGQP